MISRSRRIPANPCATDLDTSIEKQLNQKICWTKARAFCLEVYSFWAHLNKLWKTKQPSLYELHFFDQCGFFLLIAVSTTTKLECKKSIWSPALINLELCDRLYLKILLERCSNPLIEFITSDAWNQIRGPRNAKSNRVDSFRLEKIVGPNRQKENTLIRLVGRDLNNL